MVSLRGLAFGVLSTARKPPATFAGCGMHAPERASRGPAQSSYMIKVIAAGLRPEGALMARRVRPEGAPRAPRVRLEGAPRAP